MALRDLIFTVRSKFDRSGVDDASDSLSDLGEKAADLASPAKLGAAALAMGYFLQQTLAAGDEIAQFAQRSGQSAEELQILSNIAAQSGGEMDDVADAAREMQLRLAEAAALGSGPAVDALTLLNLTLDDFAGKNVDQKFALLRDRISEVEDPAQRLFVAEELLGGSVERLNGLLNVNAAEFANLRNEIGDTGIFSNEEVERLNAAHDALENLKNAVSGVAGSLAGELAPEIESASNFLTGFVEDDIVEGVTALDALRGGVELMLNPLGGLKDAIFGAGTEQAEYNRVSGRTVETVGAARDELERKLAITGHVGAADRLAAGDALAYVSALARQEDQANRTASALERLIDAQVRQARNRSRQLGGTFPPTTTQRGTFDPVSGLTESSVVDQTLAADLQSDDIDEAITGTFY